MEHIFQSGQIGRILLKNRIIMPAVHLGMCPNGTVTPEFIEFYRLRAQGGVGLIIVGGCGIDDYGNTYGMVQLSADKFIPGLKELTSAVQNHGSRIFAQLYQAGRYAHSKLTGRPAVAPSPVPSRLTGETPMELDEAGIAQVISNYALAALRAKEAGFDGVEILAGAGYLISQFLSPLTNLRQDQYGGNAENRRRFGLKVVQAVRLAVGDDFPIMVRVAGNDFMPGGNTNQECREFCQALEGVGADGINVTGGWHETGVPQLTMNVPYGAFAYLAKQVKEVVNIPVVACNRINNPLLAEELLKEGWADFIGMARPLIAEASLPQKYLQGQGQGIRPCIGCNQGCLDNIFKLKPVQCMINPHNDEGLVPSKQAKNILVVGAGPAGLEAARVAASRGHMVTIWEAGEQIGGQVNLAAVPPGRRDFGHLISWYQHKLNELKIKIIYNKQADLEDIIRAKVTGGYEEIVIATGAKPMNLRVPVEAGAKVIQAWEVLAQRASVEQNIVIVGGGAVGVETALYLARKGTVVSGNLEFLLAYDAEQITTLKDILYQTTKRITIVEMQDSLGKDIGASSRWWMLGELKKYGINVVTGGMVTAITTNQVKVLKAGEELNLDYQTVVLAVGSQAEDGLYKSLELAMANIHIIGDANGPRKIKDAILEGYQLGIKL